MVLIVANKGVHFHNCITLTRRNFAVIKMSKIVLKCEGIVEKWVKMVLDRPQKQSTRA